MDLDRQAVGELDLCLRLVRDELLEHRRAVQQATDVAAHDARLSPVGGDHHEGAHLTSSELARPACSQVHHHQRRDDALAAAATDDRPHLAGRHGRRRRPARELLERLDLGVGER